MFDREAIARAVTRRQYDEDPSLLDRHGERGREKTLQDMGHNIDQLVPAVDLGDPEMFAQYTRWLDSVLLSRGVATKYIKRCYELVIDEVRERYDPAEADAITTIINAGIAAVEKPS
jgi:hypothetical protein